MRGRPARAFAMTANQYIGDGVEVLVAGGGGRCSRWRRHGRLYGQPSELLKKWQEHKRLPRHAQLALCYLSLQLLDTVLHDVLLLPFQVLRLQPLHLDLLLRVDRHVSGIL